MPIQTISIHFEGNTDSSPFPSGPSIGYRLDRGNVLWYAPGRLSLTPLSGYIKVKVVKRENTDDVFTMDGSPFSLWLKRVPVYTPGKGEIATHLSTKDAALQLFAIVKGGVWDAAAAWDELEAALRRATLDVDGAVAAESKP